MLRMTKIFVLLASVSLFSNVLAAGITEAEVRNLISKVDAAVNALNAQGIGDVMRDDVEIIMNIDIQGHRQVMKPSKAEYLEMLKQSWAHAEHYQYSRVDLKFDIQDNMAFGTVTVNESMTVQGQTFSWSTKEEVVIELIQGKPLMTKIVAHTKM